MSSAKSPRTSAGHVIETNASGIVTIVIDDDKEPTQGTTDSNDEYTYRCRSTRPPIGVRPPVPTPGSPKFFDSENCQSILIKENKTNVIVVNSGRATSTLRADRSGLGHNTLRCCSPPPTSDKQSHNIISKTQTHYVVINKPKPTVSCSSSASRPTSPISSRPSSPQFTSKSLSSPTKLRLWQTNQSTPRTPQVVVSTRTRSHATLPPDDVESDCMDEKIFFKYLNLIPANDIKVKSKIDLNTNWPLRKVNKIAKPDLNLDGKLLLANFKSLRVPIKPVPNMGPVLNQRKLQWYREAQNYNERLQHFRANLPLNMTVRQRLQADLERLHNRLMTEKAKQNSEEEHYRRLKAQEEASRIQKQELSQELNSYANAFEISSLMGRRVRLSLDNNCPNPQQVCVLNYQIEKYCNQMDIVSVNAPQNAKLSTRITRSTTCFAGLDRIWGPRSESHLYSFTRRQRLNRYMKLDTGLDWKSRLVKKHCRSIDVEVAKITRCPCCLTLVEPEWGHSCRDSDEESIPDVSSVNDSEFGAQSDSNMIAEDESINSEIITAGNECPECGDFDCSLDCVRRNHSVDLCLQTRTKTLKTEDQTVVSAFAEALPEVEPVIHDAIMIQKVPVLQHKNDMNKKVGTIGHTKIGQNGLKRKMFSQSDSEDEIVIVNEVVRSDIHSVKNLKPSSETVIITRYVTSDCDIKPTITQKFADKRFRAQSHTKSDQIIIKKLK